MTKARNTLIAAIAALSVAVGATGVASAQDSQPKVSIHYTGDGFQGQIKNDKAKCLANREVKVHKASGKVLYTDTSESDGSWNTGNSGQVHGKFYATVDARGGCLPLVSKTLSV
jgi:hypothetical protein